MAIKKYKLPDFSFKHANQPNKPNMTVPQFKAALDSQGEELQQKFNGLVDDLSLVLGMEASNIALVVDTNGDATGIQEKDVANSTITNTSWTFNANGTLNTVTEIIGTETTTSTMNYDANGQFLSVSIVKS